MTTNERTLLILQDAHTLLEGGHWIREEYKSYDTAGVVDDELPCFCATGAIYDAAEAEQGEYEDPDAAPALLALMETIVALPTAKEAAPLSGMLGSVEGIITRWNDDHDTTYQDVLDAFTATINRLESEGA